MWKLERLEGATPALVRGWTELSQATLGRRPMPGRIDAEPARCRRKSGSASDKARSCHQEFPRATGAEYRWKPSEPLAVKAALRRSWTLSGDSLGRQQKPSRAS